MSDFPTALAELASAAAACASEAPLGARRATDDSLLAQQRALAASARLIDTASSALAAEIAHRSRRELGYDGLAQKRGMRTPEALVQQVTGTSAPAARRLVQVGTMVAAVAAHDADPSFPIAEPWLAGALRAVAAGTISAEAAQAIRAGLGEPTDAVSMDALTAAAATLTTQAASLTLERLAALAREFRDNLDAAGVAAREEERRERRYLHLYPQSDGMTRIVGLLDPESAAVVTNAIGAATSPRRGGPRFVDHDAARAEELLNDPRTPEQIALDALVELIDIAVRAHDNHTLGVRRADVRLLVSQRDLEAHRDFEAHPDFEAHRHGSSTGVAFIDGQRASVSVATAERHACDGGFIPIVFDGEGQVLNVGRTQRFHTAQQRIVIAARDGGCVVDGCDRPASWCEVHHINEFSKGGSTSVEDAVLLCRHHHLWMHNNGWRITRTGSTYWLIPPPDIDPERRPIPLRTKSPAIRRLLAQV